MMQLIFASLVSLISISIYALAITPALLGVGGKSGGGYSGPPGVSLEGASFNLEVGAGGALSRIHGGGLRVDLDVLEIATSKGLIKYNSNSIEFHKDSAKWVQVFTDRLVGINHNNQPVLKIESVENAAFYTFKMSGDGVFNDLFVNKDDSVKVLINLCMADRTITGEPTENVNKCAVDVITTHLSVEAQLDYASKLLSALSREVIDAKSKLKTLQTSGGGTEQSKSEILTAVDGKVDAFKQEVIAENNEQGRKLTALNQEVTTLSEKSKADLEVMQNDLVALNATVTANLTALSESVELQLSSLNASIESVLNQQLTSQLTELTMNISDSAVLLVALNETLLANVTVLDEKLLVLNGNLNSYVSELNDSVIALDNRTSEALTVQREALLDVVYGISNQTTVVLQTLNESLVGFVFEAQNVTQEALLNLTVELRDAVLSLNESAELKVAQLNESILTVEASLRDSVLTNLTELSAFQSQKLDAVKDRVIVAEDSIAQLNQSALLLQDSLTQTNLTLSESIVSLETQLGLSLNDTAADLKALLAHHSSEAIQSLSALNQSMQEGHALLRSNVDSLSAKIAEDLETLRSESVSNNTALYTDLSLALYRDVTRVNETIGRVNATLMEHLVSVAAAAAVDLEAVNASVRSVVDRHLQLLVNTNDSLKADLATLSDTLSVAQSTASQSLTDKAAQLTDLIASTDTRRKEYVDQLVHQSSVDWLQKAKADLSEVHKEVNVSINTAKDAVVLAVQSVNESAVGRHAEMTVQLATLKSDVDKQTDLLELRMINKITEMKTSSADANTQWIASQQEFKSQLAQLDKTTSSQFKAVNETLASSLKSLNQSILMTFNANLNSMFGYVHNLSDSTKSELTDLNTSVKLQLSKMQVASDIQNAKTHQLIADAIDLAVTNAKVLDAALNTLNASLLSALASTNTVLVKSAESDRVAHGVRLDQLNSTLERVNATAASQHNAALLAVNASQKSLNEQLTLLNASWTVNYQSALDQSKKVNDSLVVSLNKFSDAVSANDSAVKLQLAALDSDLSKHETANKVQFTEVLAGLSSINQSVTVLTTSVDKRLTTATEDLAGRMKELSTAANVNMTALSVGLTAQMTNLSSTLEKELWKTTTQLSYQHTVDGLITNNSIVAVNIKLDLALERLKTASDASDVTNKAVISSLEMDVKSTRKQLQELATLSVESGINLNSSFQSFVAVQRAVQEEALRDRTALRSEVSQVSKQLTEHQQTSKIELSALSVGSREGFASVQQQLLGVNASLQSVSTQSQLTAQAVTALSDSSKHLTSQVDVVVSRVSGLETGNSGRDIQIQHVNQQLSLSNAVGTVVNTSIPELLVSTNSNTQKVTQLTAALQEQQTLLKQHVDKHTSKVTSLTEATASGTLAVTALTETLTTYQKTTNEKLTTLTADILVKYDQLIENNLESKVISGVQATKIEHLESQEAVLGGNVSELLKKSCAVEEQVKHFTKLEEDFAEYKRLQDVKAQQYTSAVAKLSEKLEQQNSLLTIAQSTIAKQGETIESLQDELKKVHKETATQESVDQLRKLLYDMQASMIGHSSKVLDLLLSKKDSA